jgi:serine/threonine protein kinase
MPEPEAQRDGTQPAPALPGHPARIGRFEVRHLLGEGTFGRVYHGFDFGLHRDVAIKVPHPHGLTPAFRERFLREARAVATIHHANVCPVYEAGTAGDLPYVVMHFVPGPTLATLLDRREEPFPPRHAAAMVRKLALGVFSSSCSRCHRRASTAAAMSSSSVDMV